MMNTNGYALYEHFFAGLWLAMVKGNMLRTLQDQFLFEYLQITAYFWCIGFKAMLIFFFQQVIYFYSSNNLSKICVN